MGSMKGNIKRMNCQLLYSLPHFIIELCLFCRANECETVSDLTENAKVLQAKFELCKDCAKAEEMDKESNKRILECSKCSAIAMLRPKLYIVGSLPEGTRAGVLQEIDVMMELKGLKSSFFKKTTSASKLELEEEGKDYFGKIKLFCIFMDFPEITCFFSIFPIIFHS